jgi:hypothetical protein
VGGIGLGYHPLNGDQRPYKKNTPTNAKVF